MSSKVRAEEVGRWLKEPVTVAYMETLEASRRELIDACGDGGCLSNTRTIEEMYHFYQGGISAVKQAADVMTFMSDVIYTEEATDAAD
jgi:hypothetical protein